MSRSQALVQNPIGRFHPGLFQPAGSDAVVPVRRGRPSVDLIAPTRSLELPSLFGVEEEYVCNGGTPAICELAKMLLRAEIGTMKDWELDRIPLRFIQRVLRSWVEKAASPYSARSTFDFGVSLSNWLDDWQDINEQRDDTTRLYLILDSGPSLWPYIIGPLYESLYKIHPRLPASFYKRFGLGCRKCFRVFDHHDLEYEADKLEENFDDKEKDTATVQAWRDQIPKYMKRKSLNDEEYARETRRLSPRSKLRRILEMAQELRDISSNIQAPELTEEERDGFDNHGDSCPAFSLHFYSMDAVRGALDEETQYIQEVTPMPHLILPFTMGNENEMITAFRALADACKVIALAAAIVKDLPMSE